VSFEVPEESREKLVNSQLTIKDLYGMKENYLAITLLKYKRRPFEGYLHGGTSVLAHVRSDPSFQPPMCVISNNLLFISYFKVMATFD
jgi:hypothetical protein